MTEIKEFRGFGFSERIIICWGFLWRSVLTSIGSGFAGVVASAVIGFIAGAAGMETGTKLYTILIVGAGASVGLYFIWLYVHWLFCANFAGYRLRLVKQ